MLRKKILKFLNSISNILLLFGENLTFCSDTTISGGINGGTRGYLPPSRSSALPTCSSVRRKNGKNQPFFGFFLIFAPKLRILPLVAPTKKFWCRHWLQLIKVNYASNYYFVCFLLFFKQLYLLCILLFFFKQWYLRKCQNTPIWLIMVIISKYFVFRIKHN